MAELTRPENEENESLLAILHVGKELYHEIHRNIFISDIGMAESFRNRGEQFINALIIASRHLESKYRDITDGVIHTVVEFQRLICRLEERFHDFVEDGLHYTCPNEGLRQKLGRPKLVIPKEQLEGLRSLGFSWTSISKMLGVSEKTLRCRREAYDMSSTCEQLSDVTDDEVDQLAKSALEVLPNSGERMIMGWFNGHPEKGL